METVVLESQLNYQKCGEILTALDLERRIFSLKCFFCKDSHSNLCDFISHIEEKHGYLLCASLTKQEITDINDPETSFYDCDNDYNGTLEQFEIKLEVGNDPLNESIVGGRRTRNRDSEVRHDPFKDVEVVEDNKSPLIDLFSEKKVKIKKEIDGESSHDENEANNAAEFSGDDSDYIASESSDESDDEKDDDLDMALVGEYEKLPLLWNKFDADARDRTKRKAAQKKLTDALSERFGRTLKWTNLEKRLIIIRKMYRSELLKSEKRSKRNKFEPTWILSKMEFLRDIIKGPKRLADDKLSLISNEQHMKIIELYEKYPCLWNSEHIGYRSKIQRDAAIKEMLSLLEEEAKLKITDDDLHKRLYRIRLACTKEKERQLKWDDEKNPYKPICKTYTQVSFLLDFVPPYKCPHCPQVFKSQDNFKMHRSTHDGSSPFPCPICKKGFTSVKNLVMHVRRHTHEYPHVCKVCNKGFATSNEMSIHFRQHTGDKPYFCDICGKTFRTRSSFYRHKLRHEKRPIHFCKICNKGFYEKSCMDQHMNGHLNIRNKVCKTCGKTFSNLKNLWQHKLIHTGERRYVCKICSKDFTQNAGLKKHLKSHETASSRVNKITNKFLEEQKKKFPCEMCNKRFAQKIRRRQHMKKAHGVVVDEPDSDKKKLPCEYCGKEFNFNAGLQKHLKIHEPKIPKTIDSSKKKRLPAEKLLKCDYCSKKYAHEKRLARHVHKCRLICSGALHIPEVRPNDQTQTQTQTQTPPPSLPQTQTLTPTSPLSLTQTLSQTLTQTPTTVPWFYHN